MPYIIVKRSDIPSGLLQNLDLQPNTSQRSFPYQKVGQTGYRVQIVNDLPVVVAGVVQVGVSGLTAWFLGNLSDGSGTEATATLTVDTVANLADGETFTISDGATTVTFEINKSGNHVVAAGNVAVDISGDTTAADVSLTCTGVINGVAGLAVTAVDGGGTVDLTNNNQNVATALQNNTDNASTLGGAGALTDFAGATDSDALTPAAAAVNASDVLGLLSYDSASAAGALTLSAVNGALTTGALTATQHSALMDVLAGRVFTLSAGDVVGTTAFTAAGEFADAADPSVPGIRRIYETGALRISFNEGRISKMVDAAFQWAGSAGAAVAVYNDDGSLFSV